LGRGALPNAPNSDGSCTAHVVRITVDDSDDSPTDVGVPFTDERARGDD
jgi:hypothetical protein